MLSGNTCQKGPQPRWLKDEFGLSLSQLLIVGLRDSAQAGAWLIHGAITQESYRIFGWVQGGMCKTCDGLGTEKHLVRESKE